MAALAPARQIASARGAPDISVALGGTLELNFADDVDLARKKKVSGTEWAESVPDTFVRRCSTLGFVAMYMPLQRVGAGGRLRCWGIICGGGETAQGSRLPQSQ
jgi:hypothetical protein